MKKFRYFILLAASLCGIALSACKEEDDIPAIDTSLINKEYLKSGWAVTGNDVKWDLTAAGTVISKVWDGKSKLSEMISNRSKCVSLYIANDTSLFYIRHLPTDSMPYLCHSHYTLNSDSAGYVIYFSNPTVMGFYMPKAYIKKPQGSDNQLILYLRKSEVLEMMEHESDVSSYVSALRGYIDNAEIDIYYTRDTLEYYKQVDREWYITH